MQVVTRFRTTSFRNQSTTQHRIGTQTALIKVQWYLVDSARRCVALAAVPRESTSTWKTQIPPAMTKTATPQCPSLSHSYSLDSEIWNLRPVFMIVCGAMWPRSAKFDGGGSGISTRCALRGLTGSRNHRTLHILTHSHLEIATYEMWTRSVRFPILILEREGRREIQQRRSRNRLRCWQKGVARAGRAFRPPTSGQVWRGKLHHNNKNFAHTCDVAPRFGHVWGF